MTLGELKAIVDTWTDDSFVFSQSFVCPHSYRGYYDELAFSIGESVSVRVVKNELKRAFDETFHGWKGGEYSYGNLTPVHLSERGESDDEDGTDFEGLVAQMDKEYENHVKLCYNTSMNATTKAAPKKRKTKAEKLAEWEAECAKQREIENAEFVRDYPNRLLRLLHTALTVSPNTVHASSNSFHFSACDYDVLLPMDLSSDKDVSQVSCHVNYLNDEYDRVLAEQKAAEERYQKKQAALAKLTAMERELLGL